MGIFDDYKSKPDETASKSKTTTKKTTSKKTGSKSTTGNKNKPDTKQNETDNKKDKESGFRGLDKFRNQIVTIEDKKNFEDARGKELANNIKERDLFERDLMVRIIGELGQSCRTNFVDIPRRECNRLANILEIPQKETEIQKELQDIIERGINGFIADVEKLMDDKVFE